MARVGVISDTHGLVRPEALAALRGVDHLIHGGDIGSEEVLVTLRTLAPVTAVRGNNDKGPWARALPETAVVEIDGAYIYVIHNVAELDLDANAAGFAVVVAGHSHRPKQEVQDGVLFFNPGSAGPRRFSLPITVGFLEVDGGAVRGEIRNIVKAA